MKQLPRYEDYEKNILGNCIKNPSVIEKYEISPKDFYETRDHIICKSLLDMKQRNMPIGDLELREYLKGKNLIEKVDGGFIYIGTLVDNAIEHSNLEYQVSEIKRAVNLRLKWESAHKLAQAIEQGNEAEIKKFIEKIKKDEPVEFGTEFKTDSWKELIGEGEPEIEFLIEDLLPVGCLLILAGKPKIGKSLLSLLFAISIGLGLSLWDKKVTKGGVLFISTEDGKIRLQKRIWKMIGSPDKYHPNFNFYVGDCILTDVKVFQSLRATILKLRPKLIVLDPLINLFRDKGLNSGEDMNVVLRPLQDLARETGGAILVVHHARKSGSEDPLDVVQGSITISGVADGILILKSLRGESEEKKVTLEVILKDAEIPKKVVLKLDDKLRWDVEGDFEQIESKNLEDEVLDVLHKDSEGLTISNLMQITGAEYKPLYRLLVKLESENKVYSRKVGKYHTKVYTLENEWKTKLENEKPVVTDGNDSDNSTDDSSFSKTQIMENESDHLENEEIDPWDEEENKLL